MLESTQERIRADGHLKVPGKSGSSFTPQDVSDQAQSFCRTDRASGITINDLGQRLGENEALALVIIAEEASGLDLKANGDALPGQVCDGAGVPAMNALRRVTAGRAIHSRPDCAGIECKDIVRWYDTIQIQQARGGQ